MAESVAERNLPYHENQDEQIEDGLDFGDPASEPYIPADAEDDSQAESQASSEPQETAELSTDTTDGEPAEETQQSAQAQGDVPPPEDPSAEQGADTEPQEPEFPPGLLQAAGITEEQAKRDFGSADALRSAVRMLDSRFVQAGQAYNHFYSQPYPQQPATQAPAQAAPQVQQTQNGEFVLPKPEGAEDWDDDTKALFDHFNKHYRDELGRRDVQLNEQRQILQAMLNEQERGRQQQYVRHFDQFVEALGEDWKSVFGTGAGWELNHNSIPFQNRVKLDLTASQLAAGMQAQGFQTPSQDELLARALFIAFPEQQSQQIRRQTAQQVMGQQRQRLMTNRPTQRRSRPVNAAAKAAQTVEDWFRSRGHAVQQDDFDDEVI